MTHVTLTNLSVTFKSEMNLILDFNSFLSYFAVFEGSELKAIIFTILEQVLE